MRVLITGVTGFIGYHLSKALIEKGYDVYGLVRFVSTGRRLPDGIKFIYGDLTDYHSIIKAVEEVEDRGYLLLIHVPDFEKIREVLHKLLNDEKTLEQLGREARQHALKYDYRETYKPLLEILR